MASIAESNARFLNTMRGSHLKHALERNKNWWRNRLQWHFGFDIWKLPICERCEGYALWHQVGGEVVGYCQCGHTTKHPLTVEQYYEEGCNVDRTVDRQAPYVAERQRVKSVATVFGGEAGLPDENKKILIARS